LVVASGTNHIPRILSLTGWKTVTHSHIWKRKGRKKNMINFHFSKVSAGNYLSGTKPINWNLTERNLHIRCKFRHYSKYLDSLGWKSTYTNWHCYWIEFQCFYYKNFHTEMLKNIYSEHTDSHHLRSIINNLLYLIL
jgi:hypothetical protein